MVLPAPVTTLRRRAFVRKTIFDTFPAMHGGNAASEIHFRAPLLHQVQRQSTAPAFLGTANDVAKIAFGAIAANEVHRQVALYAFSHGRKLHG